MMNIMIVKNMAVLLRRRMDLKLQHLIQANLWLLIEVLEDYGRMSINTDTPPMVDTSVHLAVLYTIYKS
jgi:hypothetical protein